jgi:hypothetical protein
MKVPLPEQLDELAGEYTRRCQEYPLLVIRGQMRSDAAEFKIERMAAAFNTLSWLLRHSDQIREWMQYTAKVSPRDVVANLMADVPAEVIPAVMPPLPPVDGDFDFEENIDLGEAAE